MKSASSGQRNVTSRRATDRSDELTPDPATDASFSSVVIEGGVDAATRHAGFLASDPIRHNIIWGHLASGAVDRQPRGRIVVARHRRDVVGIVLQSSPLMRATTTPMPARAVRSVARSLADAGAELPGVTGPAAVSSAFSDHWSNLTGLASVATGTDLVYAADRIIEPAPPPGSLRRAEDSDITTIIDWLTASHHETGEIGTDPTQMAVNAVASGDYWLWESGGPVTMAALSPIIGGVTRIRSVYTPVEFRGRGYASACVAAVSRSALVAGFTPMLYTDVLNPTSNALYKRIGYRCLDRVAHYEFSSTHEEREHAEDTGSAD